MTNEYKYNLLKYLTNKIDDEVGENIPYFRNKETITNNLKTTLDNMFMQYEFKGQVISPKSDNIVIYGNYDYSSYVGYTKGFIVILNKNCEVLNIITQFNTGTPFSQLIALNVDENGLIYGIDNPAASSGSAYRFILLNNFLVSNNNEVILRKSYNFPSEYNSMIFSNKCYTHVKKAENEAKYFIVGEKKQNEEYPTLEMYLVEFTINVGSENEWNAYTNGSGTRFGAYYDFILSKNENNYNVTIIHSEDMGIYKMFFNGETITDTLIINDTAKSIRLINENLFYYANGLLFKYDNGQITNIGNSTYINLIGINVISYNLITNYETGMTNIYIGIYDGQNYVEELIYTEQTYYVGINLFYSYNIFNLNKICIQIGDNAYIDSIVISNGYNGKSFNNENSLNPRSIELYNERNKIIFARNLYNKIINNNITEATVEIPNTYLNNDNITIQELLSVNNNIMVNNISTITKNIYETLFINFINTLQITNENDENNIILNPTGATRLNISISDLIDYDNAKATKIRINYDDGTNEIKDVSNNIEQIQQSDSLIFTNYDFTVYNPATKNIKTIDIISNDEKTIYQTISDLSFASNKYYNIIQPVQINNEYDIIR